ncbi:MAG: hypothetical protein JNL82_15285 [Myxococcales bacterium]|nr:hypothetical protein [Myxococcales bacterium]
MLPAPLLALASGTAATLIWIACLGLAALAVILYFPQRFSGPLTDRERRAAHGGLRRARVLVFAAPVATLAGFVLLLPPIVTLRVPDDPAAATAAPASFASRLSSVAFDRSTARWLDAVRCRVPRGAIGERELVQAILDAASAGFAVPRNCVAPPELDPWARVSIALSLVEVATRTYILAGVDIHAGPRRQDPDPWDIMAHTLEARGIEAHVGRRDHATMNETGILRLARARVRGEQIDVHALVGACAPGFDGRLLHPDGRVAVPACTLTPSLPCDPSAARQMLTMHASCPGFTPAEHAGGLFLAAGQGETPLRLDLEGPIGVFVREPSDRRRFGDAVKATSDAFADELKRRALRRLALVDDAAIELSLGASIVLRGPRPLDPGCRAPDDHGPFSWAGMHPPHIMPGDRSITLTASSDTVLTDRLDTLREANDPTEFLALMTTITWAANALETGICREREEPPASAPRPPRPLLTLAEIDLVSAALRRDREAVGLVLLALAILSLALGLRRSAGD